MRRRGVFGPFGQRFGERPSAACEAPSSWRALAKPSLKPALRATSIVTVDKDWLDKWRSEAAPMFNTASEIERGQEFTFVAFLGHSAVDAQGEARVECDLKVVKPDGTVEKEARGLPCFETSRPFAPNTIHLSKVAIRSDGDELPGRWTFELVAHDMVSGATAKTSASVVVK